MFADEPTGSLNSSHGENVLDIMSDINSKGQTIVMVTHDIKAASRGDRIIFIRDGKIGGDLRLEKYSKSQGEEREKLIFKYLKEMGW